MALITLFGLVLRLWPLGRLGLNHFDEGIYAMAGAWSLSPRGLWSFDQTVIPYAPPGFPFLVGLAYALLGRTDFAAIAVSQLAGILTIPAVAWIGRRAFGPGSGLAAATLAAFSGPHLAFCRMALTDASFLLAWLIAIGTGMRFLEHPTALRGVAMGFAIGLAQQFKYNGWLAGAIVILTVGVGVASRHEDRRPGRIVRTIVWGLFGVAVAAMVVFPWFRFVEARGGYSALLRHQRSYLGGWSSWLPSFQSQADQGVALSGSWTLLAAGWTLAAIGGAVTQWRSTPIVRRTVEDLSLRVALATVAGLIYVLIPNAGWWLALTMAPGLIASPSSTRRLVGLWWLVFSILTPFYHPYARLWLPIDAGGWVMLGGVLGDGLISLPRRPMKTVRGRSTTDAPTPRRVDLIHARAWGLAVSLVWSVDILNRRDAPAEILPGLLDPSDSLREAADRIAATFPDDMAALRLYARPSLTFYLAGRLPVWPQPEPGQIFRGGNRRTWALLDRGVSGLTVDPPEARNWQVVTTIPTRLSLPTLLDVDPGMAVGRHDRDLARSVPLILYRPRVPGGPR